MTIYKTQAKTEEKKDLVDFDVGFSIPEKQDDQGSASTESSPPRTRRRSKATVTVASCLCFLLVTTAIVGSVMLYMRLRHRSETFICGVNYLPERGAYEVDEGGNMVAEPQLKYGTEDYFSEGVDIDEYYQTEKITVPRFNSTDKVVFLHDFIRNLTAIKDITENVCYVVRMEDAPVPKWSNFKELLRNAENGAYNVKAGLIQRNFRVTYPQITDSSTVGWFINQECSPLPMYMLTKVTPRVWVTFRFTFVVYHGNSMIDQYVVTK